MPSQLVLFPLVAAQVVQRHQISPQADRRQNRVVVEWEPLSEILLVRWWASSCSVLLVLQSLQCAIRQSLVVVLDMLWVQRQ